MINLAIPNITGNERKYLNECIDTTFVSSVGEFVTRLEKMICDSTDACYGVATSSGTTGLHLALMSVGVKQNDLVIIPSFTFIATANAVAHCGAMPWCMDISEESWTLNPSILRSELENETIISDGNVIHKKTGKRVSAIMPVYTLGTPADMDEINNIAKKYKLPVVADAAAAIGARYKERNIGKLADLTVFSLNGNKTITSGGGGMVIGNNKELMDKIRHISTTARVSIEYDHDMIGYNYRMTNIQAAVGCAQMERLNEFVEIKRKIRFHYNKIFSNIPGISTFTEPTWCKSACWFSGFIIENKTLTAAKELCEKLKINDIEARTFWKPIHFQLPYVNVPKSSMLVSERLWDKIITLPCSTNISDEELEKVSDCVEYILEN